MTSLTPMLFFLTPMLLMRKRKEEKEALLNHSRELP